MLAPEAIVVAVVPEATVLAPEAIAVVLAQTHAFDAAVLAFPFPKGRHGAHHHCHWRHWLHCHCSSCFLNFIIKTPGISLLSSADSLDCVLQHRRNAIGG